MNWKKFRANHPCDSCQGKRLKPEALAVRIDQKDISDIARLSIGEARDWFNELSQKLHGQESEIAARILKEINERLGFLVNVGLNYLSMARNSGTLSGGESQRIRLASQIGSGLTGVLYVLDEPSIGLHQRDNDRLLATLVRLRDLGNTVLVVEHDEDSIRLADYVVDMGPGAGVHGGKVVAAGTPDQILAAPESLTGRYLSGDLEIPVPKTRRQAKKGRYVRVQGATGNNLNDVTVDFPLGVLTCVTGVSGGGKSTLVLETLWKALAKRLHKAEKCQRRTKPSLAPSCWIRLSILINHRLAGHRGPIRQPIPAHSPRSENGLPACPRPRRVAMRPGGFRSTSRAGVVKPVRAMV